MNKKTGIVIGGCCLIVGILAGCVGAPARFRYGYSMWEKPGASNLATLKSLLECDIRERQPSGISKRRVIDEAILNRIISSSACMEKLGYTKVNGDSVQKSCAAWTQKFDLPICRPNATVPEPSVTRRLNSRHCEEERVASKQNPPECQP